MMAPHTGQVGSSLCGLLFIIYMIYIVVVVCVSCVFYRPAIAALVDWE